MRYIVEPVIDNAANFPGMDGAKKYWIASINSGLVASANGAVVQKKWVEEEGQQWMFVPLEGKDLGYNKIVSVKDKRVLSTKALSSDDAEKVVTEDPSGSEDQKWKLIYLGTGKFRIESKSGSRILDASEEIGAEILAVRPVPASSRRAVLYEDPNFKGKSQELAPGKYNKESLNLGKAGSIKISTGLSVTLFKDPNFKGESKAFTRDDPALGDDFANAISSIKVKSISSGGYNLSQQWQISEVKASLEGSIYAKKVTLFQQPDFQGPSQVVGLGRFDQEKLNIGDNALNSLKVPSGLRVTIYEEPGFKGRYKAFRAGDHNVGEDFRNKTSSIKVEPVITIYEGADYKGKSQLLGVGDFGADAIELADKKMASIKVPHGLIVNARQGEGAQSLVKTFDKDEPSMGDDFKGPLTALDVYAIGFLLPEKALVYGGSITLKSGSGKLICAKDSGSIAADGKCPPEEAEFTIVRSGDTKHNSYINFGDILSLKARNNKYVTVTEDGLAAADQEKITNYARFTVVRSGPTMDQSFVSLGDTISLMASSGKYLSSEEKGKIDAAGDKPTANSKWIVESFTVPPEAVHAGATNISACVADACAAAACGAAGRLVLPCGAASVPIAICGSDVVGISWDKIEEPKPVRLAAAAAAPAGVCVMLACSAKALNGVAYCGADAYRPPVLMRAAAMAGAPGHGEGPCAAEACAAKAACPTEACGGAVCAGAACSAKACGAEACGGAVCAAAACPGKVCGADACGGAVCGGDACGAKACGGEACGGDACPAKACGGFACPAKACGADACAAAVCAAKACAANACPADACAAKACAINVIPLIPVSG